MQHLYSIKLGFSKDLKRKKPLTIVLDGSLNFKDVTEFLDLINENQQVKAQIELQFPRVAMFKDKFTNHLHDMLTQGKIDKIQYPILNECLTITDH